MKRSMEWAKSQRIPMIMNRWIYVTIVLLFFPLYNEVNAWSLPDKSWLLGKEAPICGIIVQRTSSYSKFLLLLQPLEESEPVKITQFPQLNYNSLETFSYQEWQPTTQQLLNYYTREYDKLDEVTTPKDSTNCNLYIIIEESSDDEASLSCDKLYRDIHNDKEFPFDFQRNNCVKLSPAITGYSHFVGLNYIAGTIERSINPGYMTMGGIISIRKDYLQIGIDWRERWRRTNNNHRHTRYIRPLNETDLYIQELPRFGLKSIESTILNIVKTTTHPCYSTDAIVPSSGNSNENKRTGSGDANACMELIQQHIDFLNDGCDTNTLCYVKKKLNKREISRYFLGSEFPVLIASVYEILQKTYQISDEISQPSIEFLQTSAEKICQTKSKDSTPKATENLCFQLCYTTALMKILGFSDTTQDKRMWLVRNPGTPVNQTSEQGEDDATKGNIKQYHEVQKAVIMNVQQLSTSGEIVETEVTDAVTTDNVAWLLGYFLFREVVDQRLIYLRKMEKIENKVREGLPIGYVCVCIVFLTASFFLYSNTGNKNVKRRKNWLTNSLRRLRGTWQSVKLRSPRMSIPKNKMRKKKGKRSENESCASITFIADSTE